MGNDANDQPKTDLIKAYKNVPHDFPRSGHEASVAGYQDKLAMSEYEGKYYPPGTTPPEVLERFAYCSNIAGQMSEKAMESKLGKRSHMSETDILAQYLPRLIAMNWTSEPEARWIIRRVANKLNWPAPPEAMESKSS